MRLPEWEAREQDFVWYGLPIEANFTHPDGTVTTRCVVEVFRNDRRILGYLPVPLRYAEAWTQLCYSVVYWMSAWKACIATEGIRAKYPPEVLQHSIQTTGTYFAKYLHARRLIVQELLRHKFSTTGIDNLAIFDEFILREYHEWLWTERDAIPRNKEAALKKYPTHPSYWETFG